MAAYFVKYNYSSRYMNCSIKRTCIISFERFEKVDEDAIYKKISERVPGDETVEITDMVKL